MDGRAPPAICHPCPLQSVVIIQPYKPQFVQTGSMGLKVAFEMCRNMNLMDKTWDEISRWHSADNRRTEVGRKT